MSKRIFISMSLLALLTILLSVVALTFIMFQQLSEDMERELKNQALYLRVGIGKRRGLPGANKRGGPGIQDHSH